MAKIVFLPKSEEFEAPANAKVLAIANRNKVGIRFSCGACSCGTCAVEICADKSDGKLSDMQENELSLLQKIGLKTDGSVRLACQARIESGTVVCDLDFQNTYSPDQPSS